MRRKARLATALTISAALAVGSAGSAFAQEDIELDYWTITFGGSEIIQKIEEIISDFEAANPGVTVKMELREGTQYQDDMRIYAGSDAAPEMYFNWTGVGLGGEYVNAGLSHDLTDIVAERGWEDRFKAPVVALATQYGGFHGVPFTFRSQGMVYRKDLFEQAGIESEPQTYEELIEAADKLLEIGVYPIAFGGTTDWHMMRLTDNLLELRCGPETHDALTDMVSDWTQEPCATEAFEDLALWGQKYIHPALMGINNEEAVNLWFAGESAIGLEGDWILGVMGAGGLDVDTFGLFPFPTGTNRLYSFSEANYITPGLDEALLNASVDFLDYMSSPEVQQKYLGDFGTIPVVAGVDLAEDSPAIMLDWADMVASSEGAFANGDQAFPSDATTEYLRISSAVASGQLDPSEAAGEMQAFIDNR